MNIINTILFAFVCSYGNAQQSISVAPTDLTGITTVSNGEYLFGSNSLLKYDNIEFGGLSDMTVMWDMKTSNGFNTPQHGQQLNIFWYGNYVQCGWGFLIRRHDNANAHDMYTVGGAGNAYHSTAFLYDNVLPSNFDWSVYHTYRVVKEGAKITAYIDNYVFDLGNSMQTTVSTCPDKMKFGNWYAYPGFGLEGATVKNVQFMYSAQYLTTCTLPASAPTGYSFATSTSLGGCTSTSCSSPTITGVSCASGYSGTVTTTACSTSSDIVTLTGCAPAVTCTMDADTAHPDWYGAVAIVNYAKTPNSYEWGPLTEKQCQDLCLNTPTCNRIMWKRKTLPESCWMWSSIGALAPDGQGAGVAQAYDKTCVPPLKLEYDCQPNLEWWGGTQPNPLVATGRGAPWWDCSHYGFPTVESCQEQCSKMPTCAYMEWRANLAPMFLNALSVCPIQTGACYLADASHSKTRSSSSASTYCAKKQCTDSSQCSTGNVCDGNVCKVLVQAPLVAAKDSESEVAKMRNDNDRLKQANEALRKALEAMTN